VHQWIGKVEFPELKKKFIELFYAFPGLEKVLIEDKASGQSLIQEMERETTIPIERIKVDSDKLSRVHAITPLLEQGKVKVNPKLEFMEELINQAEEFPNALHDDCIDPMSQALQYLKKYLNIKTNIDFVAVPLDIKDLAQSFAKTFMN